MHSDFIHSTDGHPLYFETTDNFLDLRERTFSLLDNFRKELEIDGTKALCIVIDRGIFGADIFERFAQAPHLHLITWEKDYHRDGWDDKQPAKATFIYQRPRNHSKDIFTYQEHPWPKDPQIKRLIVRATNPRGKSRFKKTARHAARATKASREKPREMGASHRATTRQARANRNCSGRLLNNLAWH